MHFYFLDFSIIFDVLSGIVALLVSYFAFRYNRLIENSTLKFISLGFLLLGIGLLTEASIFFVAAFGIGNFVSARLLVLGTSIIYKLLQIIAYLIFAIGYIRSAFFSTPKKMNTGGSAVAVILLFLSVGTVAGKGYPELVQLSREVFVVSEVLSIVFLATLVFAGLLGYIEGRNRLSLLVLVSFGLILGAQAVALWSVVLVSEYLTSIYSGIQFIGFLSLLVFILRSRKIGSTGKATQ
jgi:hypothetical protein